MPEANNDFIKIEYDNSTIADILERINSEEENGIFLPYVQRDFVWDKERIYSLLDSLMRGYPIGDLIWDIPAFSQMLLTQTPPFKSTSPLKELPCGGKNFSGSRSHFKIFNLVSLESALKISIISIYISAPFLKLNFKSLYL